MYIENNKAWFSSVRCCFMDNFKNCKNLPLELPNEGKRILHEYYFYIFIYSLPFAAYLDYFYSYIIA